MIHKTTVILLSILLISLTSCSRKIEKPKKNQAKKLELKPMSLVIDELSCKQCVKDMAEVYAKNKSLNQVVFLTSDAFGQTTLDLDSSVRKMARRDFVIADKNLGSYLINSVGDTIKLDVNNYKEVLGNLNK